MCTSKEPQGHAPCWAEGKPLSTSVGPDWNTLRKGPTGQTNLFLFLRLPHSH